MINIKFIIIALFISGVVMLLNGCGTNATGSGSDYQASIFTNPGDTDMEKADIMASSTGRYDSNDALALIGQNVGNKNFVILDVRTPEERSERCLENSISADYNAMSFASELEKLDRTNTYLVYCRSGRRSTESKKIMQSMGFENVYNLDGGINGWIEGGGKTVTDC